MLNFIEDLRENSEIEFSYNLKLKISKLIFIIFTTFDF